MKRATGPADASRDMLSADAGVSSGDGADPNLAQTLFAIDRHCSVKHATAPAGGDAALDVLSAGAVASSGDAAGPRAVVEAAVGHDLASTPTPAS